MFKSADYTTAVTLFNSDWDQERYSRARFNANANRRVAYRQMLLEPQRKLHMSPTFGAFTAEKILGCPGLFVGVERFRDYMEDHIYGNQS